MKLDPKGLKAATEQVERSRIYGDGYEGAEAAIEAYLKATDTVLVPREATIPMIVAMRNARNERQPPSWVYRAMIQAAEGKE